jgi:uncharacterized delta-60 repeat protein
MPDGRIVVAGNGVEAVGGKVLEGFAAVRLGPEGKLDPSFGEGGSGIFSHRIGEGGQEEPLAVAVTPNGKVVLAGIYEVAEERSMAAVRLGSSGALDPGFGSGGIATRGPVFPFGDLPEDAALDPRERIVFVATVSEGEGKTRVEVSRLLGGEPVAQTPAGPPAPGAPVAGPAGARDRAPKARIKAIPKTLPAAKLKRFSGTARDPDGDRFRVQIAITQVGAKKRRLHWMNAKGTKKWSFKLKRPLRPGRYVLSVRAVDSRGATTNTFSRAAGNRVAFELTGK